MKLCLNIKYRRRTGSVFWDTDGQAATVVMETAQLVSNQFRNF